MVKKKKTMVHTEEELKKHKKGKDYVAKRLAEQESLNDYTGLNLGAPPSYFEWYAKKEWERITPLLQELPIAELDRESIEVYCNLHASRRRLQKDLNKNGISYEVTDREGNEVVRSNPSFKMLLDTIKEIRALTSQLGMTMSSRLELVVADEKEEEDQIMKLIKGG